jgi:WD40 repeat protein
MNADPMTLLQRYQPKAVKVINPDRQLGIVRFSPDGKVLVAGGHDATIRRWDATGDDLPELPPLTGHHGWVQALAFHPDGRRLFTADSWGKLCCWPFAERDARPLWELDPAHDGWIRSVAVSPDGQHVATCGRDRAVRIWSAADGRKRLELAGHAADVFVVAFHPKDAAVVSGDLTGVVKHWELPGGRWMRDLDARLLYSLSRLQDVGGVRCLGFDGQGQVLAAAGTTPKNGGNVQGTPTILLFDWESGKVQHTLQVGNVGDVYVCDLHLHPAGFVMAVTSGNPGTGKFFFFRPGDMQPFFLQAVANCHSLAVDPDGRRLVVAATNAGSNGNGRQLKNGDYPGNFSPLHVFDLPGATP